MGDVELVGLYWTISGPVEVHTGREWSLFDFRDRCAQAQRVGFAGIGIWHADLEHVLEQRTLREMRQILDDHGLTRLELEFFNDWYFDEGDERRAASDTLRRLLFDAAVALGAHHIKVGNIHGGTCPVSQIAERYAELCADAAQEHDALMLYEFMPFDPNINSIETALVALVEVPVVEELELEAREAVVVEDLAHLAQRALLEHVLEVRVPDADTGEPHPLRLRAAVAEVEEAPLASRVHLHRSRDRPVEPDQFDFSHRVTPLRRSRLVAGARQRVPCGAPRADASGEPTLALRSRRVCERQSTELRRAALTALTTATRIPTLCGGDGWGAHRAAANAGRRPGGVA